MDAEVQKKKYFDFRVKYCSLLIKSNQSYKGCSGLVESAWYDVSRKYFVWKPKYSLEGALFVNQSALDFCLMAKKITKTFFYINLTEQHGLDQIIEVGSKLRT
jgi:hypothetical protein